MAPIHWISPRDNDGLSKLEASTAPSAAPAPTIVCISSIKRIQLPAFFSSSITLFSLSSNSPRYFVPATKAPISNAIILLPCNTSGTSPATMRCASPSTIAVLPTPASPIRAGLFLVRRLSIWIIRSISLLRPIMGSSLSARASAVKSVPSWSSVGVRVVARPVVRVRTASCLPTRLTSSRVRSSVIPKLSKTLKATPSLSRSNPSNRCSTPI